MRTRKAIILTIAMLALGALLLSADAFAQGRSGTGITGGSGQFQYVIKFVCGQLFFATSKNPSGESDGAPGQYYTDINVHNPNRNIVKSHKKFALDGPRAQVHGPVTSPELFILNPDEALEITCADIRRLVGNYPFGVGAPSQGQFIKGFVVILTKFRLDVTAIYSVCPPQTATTSLSLGCDTASVTGDFGSVTSVDVVYLSSKCPKEDNAPVPPPSCGLSEVAAPSKLLPAAVTTSQLALGRELKVDLNARRMLALESARLMVYDLNGRLLHDSGFTTSTELSFKPQADYGRALANGVYFYVVMARDVFGRVGYQVNKFVVLR